MTIAYPDVSNHQGAMTLRGGTVACCAKSSEGAGWVDPTYGHYRAEARRVGAVFFAYHFLHRGNIAVQAASCHAVVGSGVNVMIDLEPSPGSRPTVQDALDFAAGVRARGCPCTLVYLPRWYWGNPATSPDGGLGAPSLAPLARAGLSLVSSDYTAYSDTGPGWDPYGGVSPVVWQWTDALPYSGQSVDFNAYRGTAAQLRTLLGYAAPAPEPPPTPVIPVEGFMYLISVTPDPTGPAGNTGAGIFAVHEGLGPVHVPTGADNATLSARMGAPVVVDTAYYQLLVAASVRTTVTVDAAALASALAPLLPTAAQAAHALAVELHDDTPAS